MDNDLDAYKNQLFTVHKTSGYEGHGYATAAAARAFMLTPSQHTLLVPCQYFHATAY